jgi:hypothetical protein
MWKISNNLGNNNNNNSHWIWWMSICQSQKGHELGVFHKVYLKIEKTHNLFCLPKSKEMLSVAGSIYLICLPSMIWHLGFMF